MYKGAPAGAATSGGSARVRAAAFSDAHCRGRGQSLGLIVRFRCQRPARRHVGKIRIAGPITDRLTARSEHGGQKNSRSRRCVRELRWAIGSQVGGADAVWRRGAAHRRQMAPPATDEAGEAETRLRRRTGRRIKKGLHLCKPLKQWWPGRESNPRHGDFQSPTPASEGIRRIRQFSISSCFSRHLSSNAVRDRPLRASIKRPPNGHRLLCSSELGLHREAD